MTTMKLEEILLVVEDDSDLREAIVESLQGLGCVIHSLGNAEDALAFSRENACFAVISDYRMPGMNGIEFCRRLKQESPRIKFVVLTGYADKQTVLDGFRVGIDDLLEKPQDLVRLREKAEIFVSERKAEVKRENEEMLVVRKIFCDEAADILRDLDAFIFKLEEVPLQPEVVDVLFRKAHTLKGSAGAFQGAEKISTVTHAYENLLQAIKKGRLKPSQALTHVLLQGADVIKSLVSDFEASRDRAVNLQPFVEALNRWTEGQVDFPATPETQSSAAIKPQDEKNDDGIIWVNEPSPITEAKITSPEMQLGNLVQPLKSDPASSEDEEDGLLVTIDKLNSFMELSGELVVLKNAYHATIKQVLKCDLPSEQKQRLEEMNQSLDKISEQIQGQIMEIRKVQLKVAFQKFPRIVRQASQDLHKQVRLEMTGSELGVDKSIAKALSSSLVHAVRNSVDHGIESPEIRIAKNKPESGVIRIHSSQVGEQVHITIDDDGSGMDPDLIKRKALEKGLITKDMAFAMPAQEAIELIFLPGFSTAEKVTNVSGRGVGMDVVRTEISKLGGTCVIESTLGMGTRLKIVIPVPKTVLVENTLLAESGGHQIVVPLVSISKITPIKDLILSKVDGRMTCQHDGMTIPLGDYRSFIEIPLRGSTKEKIDFSPESLVLIVTHKGHSLALVVDKVVDQLEAVVRPFDNVVERLLGFKGTSLLDSEHVAFVLDAESLVGAAYAA
jgi:two-component system chemotaxis sensor kinase CheA